jgi:hypothetical protein
MCCARARCQGTRRRSERLLGVAFKKAALQPFHQDGMKAIRASMRIAFAPEHVRAARQVLRIGLCQQASERVASFRAHTLPQRRQNREQERWSDETAQDQRGDICVAHRSRSGQRDQGEGDPPDRRSRSGVNQHRALAHDYMRRRPIGLCGMAQRQRRPEATDVGCGRRPADGNVSGSRPTSRQHQ